MNKYHQNMLEGFKSIIEHAESRGKLVFNINVLIDDEMPGFNDTTTEELTDLLTEVATDSRELLHQAGSATQRFGENEFLIGFIKSELENRGIDAKPIFDAAFEAAYQEVLDD